MAAKLEGFSQTKEANGRQVLLKMEVLLSNNFEIGMNLSGLYVVCGKIGTVLTCWYSRLKTSIDTQGPLSQTVPRVMAKEVNRQV